MHQHNQDYLACIENFLLLLCKYSVFSQLDPRRCDMFHLLLGRCSYPIVHRPILQKLRNNHVHDISPHWEVLRLSCLLLSHWLQQVLHVKGEVNNYTSRNITTREGAGKFWQEHCKAAAIQHWIHLTSKPIHKLEVQKRSYSWSVPCLLVLKSLLQLFDNRIFCSLEITNWSVS